MTATATGDPATLVVDAVTKRFPGQPALDTVSFTVDAPCLTVLLGANGAGKTTLLRIAAGYLRADAGTVLVDGAEAAPDEPGTRRRVGYLPEGVPLYAEMRVRRFLAFAARVRGVPRRRVADQVDAAVTRAGLAAVAQRRIGSLSRGYRQRVGLAQAIVHDPPLLLLDEPTSALDPEQVQEARQLLRDLAADRAVVVSTHLLAEAARIADRVVVLHEGRVAATGRADELGGVPRRVAAVVRAPAAELGQAVAAQGPGWRVVESASGTHRVEVDGADAEHVARWVVGRGWGLVQLSPPGETLEEAYLRIISEARTPHG